MASSIAKLPVFRTTTIRGYAQLAPLGGISNYELKSTVLPNKLIVASADNESSITRISIVFRAGSRNETSDNLGVTHVLRNCAGLSTTNASQFAIIRNIQQVGASLSATSDRETISYTLEGTRQAVEKVLPFLTEVATQQIFKPWELSDIANRLLLDIATRPLQLRAIDLLHNAAFRSGLGNSLFIPKSQIGKISSETLQHYVASNFLSGRASVVGLGVNITELEQFAQGLKLESGESQDTASIYKGGELRCPLKCSRHIDEDMSRSIFEKFYNLASKDEQDIYLQGLVEVRNVQQKRKRKVDGKDRNTSYAHFLSVGSKKIKVCQNTFCSIHVISVDRLKRIKKLLVNNETPRDKRGKHPKGNAISEGIRNLIRTHISSYPVHESHYSGNEYRYIDARLNVKIMYDMFRTKHPETKVTYHYYLKYFHENFNLHFGRPQVDTCNKCEEFTLKIRSSVLGDAAKKAAIAEKMVHERRAKKFYTALRSTAEECKKCDDLGAVAFDYMQNLQLPLIPVQDLFYLTQLTVSVFCIHDMKTDKSYYYVYSENTAAKTPNEVCSFLMNFIENYLPEKITELRLFSDNCPGQNKNHCVVRFCMALVESGRFKKIQQFYPIRGHSFLPCDRDFGVIKRSLRKHDRIYDLHQYTEIIVCSSLKRKFTVHEIQVDDILDFKSWWPAFYKKDTTSEETQNLKRHEKVTFTISKFYHLIHDSSHPGCLKASEYINGFTWHSFSLAHAKRTKNVKVKFPELRAYVGPLPILASKVEHLKILLQWVEDDFKPFYEAIINSGATREPKKKKSGNK